MRPRLWWVLAFFTLVLIVFGATDIVNGVQADPGITLALSGMTPDEVRAEDPVGYRLYDFATRSNGVLLALLGVVLTTIIAIPYRSGQRWAWAVTWVFPVWAAVVPILYLSFGIAPGQPPAPPMVSGPIIAVITALVLIADARRFGPWRTSPASMTT